MTNKYTYTGLILFYLLLFTLQSPEFAHAAEEVGIMRELFTGDGVGVPLRNCIVIGFLMFIAKEGFQGINMGKYGNYVYQIGMVTGLVLMLKEVVKFFTWVIVDVLKLKLW